MNNSNNINNKKPLHPILKTIIIITFIVVGCPLILALIIFIPTFILASKSNTNNSNNEEINNNEDKNDKEKNNNENKIDLINNVDIIKNNDNDKEDNNANKTEDNDEKENNDDKEDNNEEENNNEKEKEENEDYKKYVDEENITISNEDKNKYINKLNNYLTEINDMNDLKNNIRYYIINIYINLLLSLNKQQYYENIMKLNIIFKIDKTLSFYVNNIDKIISI